MVARGNRADAGRIVAAIGVLILGYALLGAQEESQEAQPVARPAGIDSAYAVIRVGFEELKPVFQRGCFDCHSSQTDFPWYHALPLIGSWMDGHIREAREELDFSSGFPFAGPSRRQADNLLKIKREIETEGMPLLSYRLVHWGAAPNKAERDSIFAWIDRSLILLAAHGEYPFNRPDRVPKDTPEEEDE